MPIIPAGMQGGDKGTPLLSILGQLLNSPPGMVESLELPCSRVTPVSIFPLVSSEVDKNAGGQWSHFNLAATKLWSRLHKSSVGPLLQL